MTKVILILIVLAGLAASCGEAKTFRSEIPHSRWVPIFFEEIDRMTRLAGISSLKETRPPEDDLEIRIWRGFGLEPLEGFILKKTNGIWSAWHLLQNAHNEPPAVDATKLAPPKSGWNTFWKLLYEKGLLTIRDAMESGCEPGGMDGISYVVEINRDGGYRTYMSPQSECAEAPAMEEIGIFIGMEFDHGSKECKRAEWFPCAKILDERKRYGTVDSGRP